MTQMMIRKSLVACLLLAMPCAASAGVEIGKTYRIVPDANAEKSLFVKDASLDEKAAVVVWTETNVPAQQWTAEDAGDGNVAWRNVYTGMYLDASNISISQRSEPSAWTLELVDESTNAYLLKQNKYLRVISTTDGRQPTVGSNAQTWHLVEVEPCQTFNSDARQRMLNGFLRQYMIDKGSGYRTFLNGGWGEAETMEALLDCYEATGDRTFLNVFESCYSYMRYHVGTTWNSGTVIGGYNWYGYDFNDDVMWLIIAAARAYHLTGKQTYLNDAKRNFDLIWERAYLGYVGLLRWAEQSGDRNGANSCINGPAEVAACYIAAGTGDDSYYEKARELYGNQRKHLFVPSTGQVYDSVVFDPSTGNVTSRNTWASTYNQGTMLGAAVLLYRHFGDEQYRQDADRIIAYAKQNLCNGHGVVHVCQNADGDFQGFKGILMRYAGLYAREFSDADSRQWLIKNAFHAYNNMNSKSFGHSAWLTKAGEDGMYGEVNYTASSSAFGASTALTAACSVSLEDTFDGTTTWKQTLQGTDASREGDQVMTFHCQVERAGHYRVNVYYRSDEKRNVYLTVNQADAALAVFPAAKEKTSQMVLFVTLTEGDNTLRFNCDPALPPIEKIEVIYLASVPDVLEAEHAVASGQATIANDDDASGGQYVNYIGSGTDNLLTFKYDAPDAGKYNLDITYFCAQNRQMYVRVNNGTKTTEVYPSTGSWGAASAQVRTVTVTLKAGTNTIVLGNDMSWAPYIDKIELKPQGGSTAVSSLTAATMPESGWYLLNGIRTERPTANGIYIHGHKKYMVRK